MKSLLTIAFLMMAAVSFQCAATSVQARGLFADGAILVIDGKQKMLKVGDSYRGVTLIEADSKKALVEMDGKRRTLLLSTRISSEYKVPELSEVRLQSSAGGHYVTPGRINNRPVTMMVDTGATAVSMSSVDAKAIGVDYLEGDLVRMNTANGSTIGYMVMLKSVSVGTVTVSNVQAVINEGEYPKTILLGNSYLSKVDLSLQQGVLVLKSRF